MEQRPALSVARAAQAFQAFVHLEASGGLCLMAATLLALAVGNSPFAGRYAAVLDLPIEVRAGSVGIAKPLLLWINDGLMAVFFLLVGLELKREVLEGHLASLRKASLPAVAAVGGMAAPAAIYAALNWGDPAALDGWAVPAATDIAFALGVLALVGPRVPAALKAFLLSVAIFDDLGAIVVIALFYTADLSTASLVAAAIVLSALVGLNRLGVTRLGPYLLLGVPLWVSVLKSGVHATLAGVALAMCIPSSAPTRSATVAPAQSPLRDLEDALHPWVAFGVLPMFAFANAGVPLGSLRRADLVHPVPLGIVLGLFGGKQVGIMALSWLAVKARLAALPEGVGWSALYGAALLCGIGFTMSLFIASLAFEHGASAYLGMDRLGVLMGTLVSGLSGYLVLRVVLNRPSRSGVDG